MIGRCGIYLRVVFAEELVLLNLRRNSRAALVCSTFYSKYLAATAYANRFRHRNLRRKCQSELDSGTLFNNGSFQQKTDAAGTYVACCGRRLYAAYR